MLKMRMLETLYLGNFMLLNSLVHLLRVQMLHLPLMSLPSLMRSNRIVAVSVWDMDMISVWEVLCKKRRSKATIRDQLHNGLSAFKIRAIESLVIFLIFISVAKYYFSFE